MKRRNNARRVDGILVLDKPPGLTSNAALQRVKGIYFAQKAGHTGSLDPLATGVLPICFGEATKWSQFLLDSEANLGAGLDRLDDGSSAPAPATQPDPHAAH